MYNNFCILGVLWLTQIQIFVNEGFSFENDSLFNMECMCLFAKQLTKIETDFDEIVRKCCNGTRERKFTIWFKQCLKDFLLLDLQAILEVLDLSRGIYMCSLSAPVLNVTRLSRLSSHLSKSQWRCARQSGVSVPMFFHYEIVFFDVDVTPTILPLFQLLLSLACPVLSH